MQSIKELKYFIHYSDIDFSAVSGDDVITKARGLSVELIFSLASLE